MNTGITMEDFKNLTLEEQIEMLKSVTVVAMPTCGCQCEGNSNGGMSATSVVISQKQWDSLIEALKNAKGNGGAGQGSNPEVDNWAKVWSMLRNMYPGPVNLTDEEKQMALESFRRNCALYVLFAGSHGAYDIIHSRDLDSQAAGWTKGQLNYLAALYDFLNQQNGVNAKEISKLTTQIKTIFASQESTDALIWLITHKDQIQTTVEYVGKLSKFVPMEKLEERFGAAGGGDTIIINQ